MQHETKNHPCDENDPCPPSGELQLPNKPENRSGQQGYVGDCEVMESARVHFWRARSGPAASKALASPTISAFVRVQGLKNGSTSISGKPRRVISATMCSRKAAEWRWRERRRAS